MSGTEDNTLVNFGARQQDQGYDTNDARNRDSQSMNNQLTTYKYKSVKNAEGLPEKLTEHTANTPKTPTKRTDEKTSDDGGGGSSYARVNLEEYGHRVIEKYERILRQADTVSAISKADADSKIQITNHSSSERKSSPDYLTDGERTIDDLDSIDGSDDEADGNRAVIHGSGDADITKETDNSKKAKNEEPHLVKGVIPYMVTKLGLYRRALILERSARARSENALAALTNQLHATSAALSRRDRVISDLLVDLVSLEQTLHLQRQATGAFGGALPPSTLDVIRGNITGDENNPSGYMSGSGSSVEDRLDGIFGMLLISQEGSSKDGNFGKQPLPVWLPSAKDKVAEILSELESLKTSFRVLHKDAAEERANLRQKLLLAGRDAVAIADERRMERSRFQSKLGEAKQAVSLLRNELIELKEKAAQKEKEVDHFKNLLKNARKAILGMSSTSSETSAPASTASSSASASSSLSPSLSVAKPVALKPSSDSQAIVPPVSVANAFVSSLKTKHALSQSKLNLAAEITKILGDSVDNATENEIKLHEQSAQDDDEPNMNEEDSIPTKSSHSQTSERRAQSTTESPRSSSPQLHEMTMSTKTKSGRDSKLLRSSSSIAPNTVSAAALNDFSELEYSKSELTASLKTSNRMIGDSQLVEHKSALNAGRGDIYRGSSDKEAEARESMSSDSASLTEPDQKSLQEQIKELQKVNVILARRAFDYKTRLDTLELQLRKFAVMRVLHYKANEPYEVVLKKVTSTGDIFLSVVRQLGLTNETSSQSSTSSKVVAPENERSDYTQPLGSVIVRPLPNALRFLLLFTSDGNRQMTFDCETNELRETIIKAIEDMKSAM